MHNFKDVSNETLGVSLFYGTCLLHSVVGCLPCVSSLGRGLALLLPRAGVTK